jgi:hypothetical protein
MTSRTAVLIAFACPVLLSGCDQVQHPEATQTQASAPTQPPTHGNYSITSTSSDGTFLLESQSGNVLRYSVKDDAFLEVVVTSKILRYERGADGKMHVVDPKNDPLEIR